MSDPDAEERGSEAARIALGESVEEETADEPTDEPGESSSGSDAPNPSSGSDRADGDSVTDALLSTSPSKDLKNVESPWRPDVGGSTRINRAFQKLTNVSGMPAIADLGIGVAEMVWYRFRGGRESGESDPESEADNAGGVGGV